MQLRVDWSSIVSIFGAPAGESRRLRSFSVLSDGVKLFMIWVREISVRGEEAR